MSFFTLLVIAVGVSADAFAVAVAKGLHMRRITVRDAGGLAIGFGLFQGLMPIAGWLLGRGFHDYITEIDHWIAFGLLVVIGAKMIHEAFSPRDDEADFQGISLRELLALSVATSIDALAVGISFAFLDVAILPAATLIGVLTAVVTLIGVFIGHRAGGRFGRPAEIAGGVILILIGTRILLDHLGVF
ncbi:manganese efflux pump MntP family protein [Amorphoplanes digitatis]|uniref:Putative manganese efflux pump MntP n=1 Tax=Actinoplanes digitatis TaxID=1868 RepID=A0A7W7HYL9_9ACTN|nr:manganese efflux pump MntP family protein [Actinoplanes digitatis]MBB4763076.1 putative Mn2+ efflux pump MntP [Actinoplanes digitatis]BFE72068.1 manganese efflux pump MntP family protein [Actinoplanes digitatis]GID97203.1 membrane protein [Actinoplanes digitatis]